MNFRGREIDPIALWENYVDFPANMRETEEDIFLPKVQCPNPKHDTLKKHFQINVSQPTVHCFAHCGISGSYEHAIAIIEGVTPREAKKIILKHQRSAKISGSARVQRANARKRKSATAIRPGDLRYDTFIPQLGYEFLESRNVSEASVSLWELGWDADERRIVIPGKDENGRLRFLIRRSVLPKDHPKYLYTEGFPKTKVLFGACFIDPSMVRSDGIVLVEGSFDTILNHQNGLKNTGGILGTGISDEQVAIIAKLRPKRIFHMFDRDTAGVHNIEIATKKLRKYPQFVCRYPKGKSDPAELTEAEAQRMIERAIPMFKFHQRLNVVSRKGITVG